MVTLSLLLWQRLVEFHHCMPCMSQGTIKRVTNLLQRIFLPKTLRLKEKGSERPPQILVFLMSCRCLLFLYEGNSLGICIFAIYLNLALTFYGTGMYIISFLLFKWIFFLCKVFDVASQYNGLINARKSLNPPHYDGVQSLVLYDKILFSGSRDTCIKKWDLEKGELIQSLNNAHKDWICAMCFLPGGQIVLSGKYFFHHL